MLRVVTTKMPKMKVCMSVVTIVMVTKVMSGLAYISNRPGCYESCSEQVNCTVSYQPFCHTNQTSGPDIAAAPVHLHYETTEDSGYQNLHLYWKPPQDGSYNYLKGFSVQLAVIAGSGHGGTHCYDVVPASDWFSSHRELVSTGGVVFFMDCLRTELTTNLEIRVSIFSLPLKPNAAKLAYRTIFLHPQKPISHAWDPKFKKWADSNNTMHLVIQNPLPAAHYYSVQILTDGANKVVFQHIFPAKNENKTKDATVIWGPDGYPHYLIFGLAKEDNYTIMLDALDGNKSFLPHIPRVQTRPFRLNFTSLLPVPVAARGRELDNSLIIMVSVFVVVIIAVFGFLIWKGIIGPRKLRNWVQNSVFKLARMNNHGNAACIIPVYCQEDENYMKAVESHVALLRRYVDVMSTPQNVENGCSLCAPKHPDHVWVNTEMRENATVIYLSPRMEELADLDNVDVSQLTALDNHCYQALHSFHEQRLMGHGIQPYVVTLDCFHHAELAAFEAIRNITYPMQQDQHEALPEPLRLASFGCDGWQLENLEQLVLKICHHQETPQELPPGFAGWMECLEAKTVKRYLSQIREQDGVRVDEVITSMEQRQSPVIGNECSLSVLDDNHQYSDAAHYGKLVVSCPDADGKGHGDWDFRGRHEEEFQQHAPLIAKSRGYGNNSSHPLSENFSSRCYSHQNGYLKSAAGSYNENDSPVTNRIHSQTTSNHYPQYHTDSPNYHTHKGSHEHQDSVLIREARTNIDPHGVAIYKPDLYSKNMDAVDPSPRNSIDSDSLPKNSEVNGYVKGLGRPMNGMFDNSDWNVQRNAFIPPSLCLSNSNSLDSVCERLNKVNENAGWSDLNLAK